MMRAKKQVVKEFYPEGHSPLWMDVPKSLEQPTVHHFVTIDWDRMEKEMHHSIVTTFRENFTKRQQHGGDIHKEFRSDGEIWQTQKCREPLDAVINRFLDENKEYTIVSIEYNGGGWMDQEVNNQASALVLFEVEER